MNNDFHWLAGKHFQSATCREQDWVFAFDGQIILTVECLWRLIDGGRIRITSEDDGQQFGLPAPLSAANEINKILSGAPVIETRLRDGTLDLSLTFDSGCILEIVPTSAGYEAWNLSGNNKLLVATGGGELTTFDESNTRG